MANSNVTQTLGGVQAAADLSALQYHLVKLSAKDAVNLAILAVDSALMGVLQNKPKSGEFATVAYGGISKVVAGAAITVNTPLTTSTSGRAITVTSLASGQEMVFGRALTAAGADGDVIEAVIFHPVRWTGAA